MYAATVLSSLALFVPFVFLPSFAVSVGVDPVSAAALVGVIGVASVVGRLAIGALADRIGRIRTFRACFAILASSFVIWLVAGSFPALLAFAVVLGVGYGGWIALQPTVIAELFGVRGLGGLVGLIYTSGAIGALLRPAARRPADRHHRRVPLGDRRGRDCARFAAFLVLLPLGRARRSPTPRCSMDS